MGRVDDQRFGGCNLIKRIREVLPYDKCEILSASIRSVGDVEHSFAQGADICTMPPTVFEKMYDHILTDKGLQLFDIDYKKTLEQFGGNLMNGKLDPEERVLSCNFTVYSKDGCPYCEKVEQVLKMTGLNFVTYKLDKHFDREGFISEFGEGSTFPQVVVNGRKLGGCVQTVEYLQEKNLV